MLAVCGDIVCNFYKRSVGRYGGRGRSHSEFIVFGPEEGVSSWVCWILLGSRSGEEDRVGVKVLSLILRGVIWGWEGDIWFWAEELEDSRFLLLVPQSGCVD